MAEASAYVGMVAQPLNEIERTWIATHNRLRAAETTESTTRPTNSPKNMGTTGAPSLDG
jgi:hypothetical protein